MINRIIAFFKATPEKLAAKQLHDAKMSLLEWQCALDKCASNVEMLQKRVKRLEGKRK